MRPRIQNHLRVATREAGLSLLEIARETGVSYSMLRRLASGSGDVCLADAVAVSAVVGRPVEQLFELRYDAGAQASSPALRGDASPAPVATGNEVPS